MSNVTIIGNHDYKTIEQINNAAAHPSVVGAALLPDGHYGYGVPIGGVIAYHEAISPGGVGFDIACGVKAVQLDFTWDELCDQVNPNDLADLIAENISFGLGRTNDDDEVRDHPLFDSHLWRGLPDDLKRQKELARDQLGTVGSGNHYVDVLCDENGFVWIATHFGSRGFGHKTATYFLKALGSSDRMEDPPAVIDFNKTPDLFYEYHNAMELAGMYAYAGRDYVVNKVIDLIGASRDSVTHTVHNHHNYAWSEHHPDVGWVWVVRKGATPAAVAQSGFVGSSMAGAAVILTGIVPQPNTFNSTVHGTGRIMSRTAAAGKYRRVEGKRVRTQGSITKEMHERATQGIILRGGGYDESPGVYRSINDVLPYLGNVMVETQLYPRIVVMAGADIRDPYKD